MAISPNKDTSEFIPKYIKKCEFCGCSNFAIFQTKDTYNIIKCNNCGLICLDYDLSSEHLHNIYAEQYFKNENGTWKTRGYPNYFTMEDALRKTFRKRIKNILKIIPGGNLLDIGCGPGFFLDEAKKYFNVKGVEISKFASSYAKNNLNINIINKPFDLCDFKTDAFNVVTMWDAIEHLIHPKDDINEIYRILKPDGLIVIQTGDIESLFRKLTGKRWHLYNVPEHLYFFSKNILLNLLIESKFAIKKVSYDWSFYSVAHIFDRLIRIFLPSKGYAKQDSFLSHILMPVNLFDIVTIYAIKRN